MFWFDQLPSLNPYSMHSQSPFLPSTNLKCDQCHNKKKKTLLPHDLNSFAQVHCSLYIVCLLFIFTPTNAKEDCISALENCGESDDLRSCHLQLALPFVSGRHRKLLHIKTISPTTLDITKIKMDAKQQPFFSQILIRPAFLSPGRLRNDRAIKS